MGIEYLQNRIDPLTTPDERRELAVKFTAAVLEKMQQKKLIQKAAAFTADATSPWENSLVKPDFVIFYEGASFFTYVARDENNFDAVNQLVDKGNVVIYIFHDDKVLSPKNVNHLILRKLIHARETRKAKWENEGYS